MVDRKANRREIPNKDCTSRNWVSTCIEKCMCPFVFKINSM